MNSELILTVAGFIFIIGFLRIIKYLLTVINTLRFARVFLHKYREYCNSFGSNAGAYNWLIENSQAMQWNMGEGGLANYKPFGSTHLFQNHSVILNGIPEVRQAFTGGFSGRYIEDQVRMVEDFLVRHIGLVKLYRKQALRDFFNPVAWFQSGVRAIVASPLWLLEWTGILSKARVLTINQNPIFKLLELLFVLVSGAIGFIASIEPAIEFIKRHFNLP